MNLSARQRLAGRALRSAAYLIAVHRAPSDHIKTIRADALRQLETELEQLGLLSEWRDAEGRWHLPRVLSALEVRDTCGVSEPSYPD